MAVNGSFNDHVLMFPDKVSRPSTNTDTLIGFSISVSSFIGFFGNVIAFAYFTSTGKNDLSSRLYQHMCIVDLMLCLCQVPVIGALLSNRDPGMFNSALFCWIYVFVHQIVKKIYPMAVFLLSLSRTIAIVYPFYAIKKRLVITALYVYLVHLIVYEGARHIAHYQFVYGVDSAYCYPAYNSQNGSLTEQQSTFLTIDFIFLSIQAGVPPVLTFFSFVISTKKLSSNSSPQSSNLRRQRRAAVTITIFTGVFLFCYLPSFVFFLLMVVLTVTESDFKYDSGPFKTDFIFWYAWLLVDCLLNSVNACLDVIIYFTRMKDCKVWILRKLRIQPQTLERRVTCQENTTSIETAN